MSGRVLAVDGGGSKTDVLLVDTDGRVLAQARGPTSSPQVVGLPQALAVLDALVAQVRRAVDEPGQDALADHAAVYLSGLDLPQEVALVEPALRARGWAPSLTVENDTFAVLRVGTQHPDAVAVVCGTGINCVGRAADGRVSRFLALGAVSGDWGGGWHLGEQALWHAARGQDGRGPATALQSAIAEHYDRPDVLGVAVALHLGEVASASLRDLVPLVLRAAADGDAVAGGLVDRLGAELAVLATVTMHRLGLLTCPVDLVLGGGVVRSRDPLLLGAVTERVLTANPQTRVLVVDEPPVLGAALLGLDVLGLDVLGLDVLGAAPAAAAALRRAVAAHPLEPR